MLLSLLNLLAIHRNFLFLGCDLFSVKQESDSLASLLGLQHEDFLEGHPSEYYSYPSTLNYGVLMGYDALMLAGSHLI